MIAFLREFLGIPAGAQEVLAAADLHRHGDVRRADRADQGLRGGAVHLHDLLIGRCASSASRRSTTTARPPWSGWRIVAAAQEERFTRKKADADFPAHAVDYCLQRGGHRPEGRRPRRVLRQAVPQVRAAARNLSRLQPARIHVVPHGDAGLDPREAVPEEPARRASSRRSIHEFDWRKAALRRASSEPCRVGLLSFPVRGGGRADHGRRRRMGDHLGRRSARERGSRSTRRSTSRTASGCSTRRSPTTPASRSIRASTR